MDVGFEDAAAAPAAYGDVYGGAVGRDSSNARAARMLNL
jgi:hypothetical protein